MYRFDFDSWSAQDERRGKQSVLRGTYEDSYE
jgi:hypothetical protein